MQLLTFLMHRALLQLATAEEEEFFFLVNKNARKSFSIANGNYINGAWKVISNDGGVRAAAWKRNSGCAEKKKKCKIRSVGEGCSMYIFWYRILAFYYRLYIHNFAVYAHKCSHRLCIHAYIRKFVPCWGRLSVFFSAVSPRSFTHIVILLFVDISSSSLFTIAFNFVSLSSPRVQPPLFFRRIMREF